MKEEQEDIDKKFMLLALEEARKAFELNEVPVGSIITIGDKVIARGHNLTITESNPLAHAEGKVISKAGEILQNYRLNDTTLYVTLEPCMMCVGAIIHARIKRVVFGASDLKSGAAGSAFNLLESPLNNHHPEVIGGVLKEECTQILQEFFAKRRKENKATKKNAKVRAKEFEERYQQTIANHRDERMNKINFD